MEGPKSPEASTAVAANTSVNAPVPQPAPQPMYAPTIVATKDDGLPAATTVAPGGTINYTVNINNNGVTSPADDALNVMFSDMIDAHTTLVPGSPVGATSDKYNTIGNVQITIPDGSTDLLGNDFDPDTGNNAGMTVTAETKSSTACTGGCSNNVAISANGSFTYDPPLGFTGTDTFTYTANSGTASVTQTVTITVANKLWFINNNAAACTLNCDGRLSHPFTSLANFNAANLGGAGQPGDNDWIFVYESAGAYTGPANLRLGQKFIGQDATATSLVSLTGFTQPSGTDPLPAFASGNGIFVQITSAAIGISLNSGNTLRGFTVGNTTGAKISGNNFGTLTVGNSVSPDVTLNGTGQALSLTTGTLAVTGGFVSVTTTSSTAQGISLAGVADSGAGAFSFGPTSVSGSASQGILIGTSMADLNFGITSVTGGTDAISLQNNSAGVKTFASITTSGNSGVGFLHGTGGGPVVVSGATSITNPGGDGIDISGSNANLSFAATTVSKNAAGIGVDLTNNATRTISFTSLASTTTTGFALNANNSGTVNVTTGSLTQSGAGGGAASLTNTALGLTFTTVSSNGGVNGLLFSGGSGTFTSGTTNLQNNTAIGISMSGSAVAANFGNTVVNSSAGDAVDLSSNTGTITFADLDLTPDSGLRGLDAQNNTGTITSTSGDIAAPGGAAVFIDGPAGRTPLAMVLNNVDSTNASAADGGVNLTDVSGNFTVNDATLATNVVNSTGTGITVNNSTAAVNFGNTSVTGSGNGNGDDIGTGIILTNNNGGVTFSALTITPDSGERGLFATDNDAASAAGTITTASGSITTINDVAIAITGASAAARTPLSMVLTLVSTNGGANGILVERTSGTFTVNGTGTTDGTGGVINATSSSGVRFVDGPTVTLKNMNLTGNGTAQTVLGSDGTCGGNLRTGNNLSCVANLYLQNMTSVTLDNLNVTGSGQMGINGNGVSGFSLANSAVTGNGNQAFENGITFQNLSGTNSITDTTVKNNASRQIHIGNIANNTTTTLNITGTRTNNAYPTKDTSTTLIGNDATGGVNTQQGILLETFGGTNISPTLNLTGVVFNNNSPGNAVDLQPLTSGSLGGTTNNCAFDTNAGGVIISAQNAGGGTYNITNSEFNRTALQAILYAAANPTTGTLQGTVQGNTIGTAGQAGSACFPTAGCNGTGIDVNFIGGSGSIQLRIQSNTVQQFDGNGIRVKGQGNVSPDVNVNIVNNTISTPFGFLAHGIDTNIGVSANGADPDDNVDGCINMTGNTISGTFEDPGAGVQFGIVTNVRFLSHHRLPGYAGSATAVGGPGNAVTDFIIANNTTGGKVFTQRGASGDYPGGAACTTPLLLGPGGVDSFSTESDSLATGLDAASLFDNLFVGSHDLNLFSASAACSNTGSSVSQPQLDQIVAAATSRWLATGLSPKQISAIRELRFEVGDLRDSYLGEASGNRIVVDRDAQGKGWFVDATPADDSEFQNRTSHTRRYTSPLNLVAGRIDLLTTIEHEIGHRLGLVDLYLESARDNIMYAHLTAGERRTPAMGQAAHAKPGSLVGAHHLKLKKNEVKGQKAQLRNHVSRSARLAAAAAPFAGETVSATIGTLPAGGSVTIKFSVTVNNPPNLTLLGPPRVENQGLVTADGGISVLTDDTDQPGGLADKTRTLIDLFDTTTTLVSDLNPSNFGDQVTFTATINETPVQGTANPGGTVDFIDVDHGNAVICDNVPVVSGQAQCQTSSLAAVTHQIRADYSGDGNFDPSQSAQLEQVVIPCTPNPIVTNANDSGAGSLRQALADVCSGTTITFAIEPGTGPHTITLLTELVVAKNVTIKNASGERITVSGNNLVRVFNINPSKTVSIIGLTIANGKSATAGGGVLNDGTLTIVNSTLTGNNTDIDGGAISNSGPGVLTLINTTISGNGATGNGGGLVNLGGTVTSINSTFTNNRADSDGNGGGTGGGIHHGSGTTTLKNTIVAGNFNEDGTTDAADDISGTVDATSSFNLIGTGGAGGLTNGVNGNQVGVANADLGALADNGGLVFTHALLPTSPAVETGSNANLPTDTFDLDSDAGTTTLPVDGRGLGFPRNADSSDVNTTQVVDIGAFELHPSIEDIANQTTNEDVAKDVTFNLGDDTGSLIATVTATSSNTTLVPNAPANLSFAGSGGMRTLTITPALDQSGTTTITVTVTATNGRTATDTFDLTVNAVNDAPVANDDSYSTNEDTPLVVNAALGVLANDTDIDTPPGSLTAVLVSGPSNELSFTLNPDGSFSYTPDTNFNGSDSFTYKANDGTSDSNIATVTITVNAVNDAPTVQNNTGITVAEGSTNNTITSTMLTVNDVDNTATQIVFTIGTAPVNGTLKKTGVALAAGDTFTQDDINNNRITYDHNGSNTTSDSFTFTVSDGAGGTIGLTTFNITITAANDAPSITAGGTLSYTENDPATAIDTTITVSDDDSPNMASATVQITANYVNGQDVLSFANTGTISGSFDATLGKLTLTGSDTVANYQAALRAVKYNNTSDNPSTLARTVSWTVNDGELNSNIATSTINITAVNDSPTVAINTGITVEEGSINNVITNTMLRVDDVDNTAAQLVFTIGTAPANGTLKKLGVALAAGGTFTQDDINNNRITYDHDGSQTTSDSFTFTVSDGVGGTIGLTTFNITIGEVNDAPAITAGGTLNYTENDAATAIDTTITVTDVDSPNLASATVQITGNYVNGEDVLSFTNTGTITGVFAAGSGTLTLTGIDTLANYQAALRAVRYNNTSDNPSTLARTVSWTVNDAELNSNIATSTINITAVNDAPVNNVPSGTQSTNQNTPLPFSSGTGNQISVTDADAGGADVQVTLTATNGTVTLATTAGLTSSSGDGTANVSMQGSLTEVNAAMNGMTFNPMAGFSGAASLTIVSDDLGNTGTDGPKQDTDVVNIQVATNVSIQDAQVAEPSSGSVNMIFTVTLSAPAPGGGASVNFTTVQLAPALNHATAGQDYTTTSGTVNFAAGEQFKTILVPVLSDNKKNEANESFEVTLSGPVNATIADGTATGTILIQNLAGAILISEIRTSGPEGSGDDFVEIYNNSDSPHPVPVGGYGLFKIGASCSATPVLIGIIPAGTVIPGRGHFLFTGSAYSLANYGGTGAATGDASLLSDIEDDRNVAIFSTTSVGSISSANRLDAVGFGPNVGGVCDLFREGNTLTPTVGSVFEYSYFRDECGKKGNPSLFGPCPTGGLTKDSNINSDDFIFADTGANLTPAGQRLGAPGPQNLGSPRLNLSVLAVLLDSTKGAAASPNRVRDNSAIGPNASQGTLSIRRRFVNNTGAPVTRLRFRVVDISTTFVPGGVADLRLLTSGNITVSVNDPATCTAATLSTPCNVTVLGTILEEPPVQPLGGGYNSSTVTLGTPLAPGASLNLQFVLGVQSSGSFKFFFNIEALP